MNPILVLTTATSMEEAKKISSRLLEERLAACTNIVGPVKSFFWWQNKIDKTKEFMIFIKTEKKLFSKVAKTIKKTHSYQVPEIIALPTIEVAKDYLDWMRAMLAYGEK